MKPIVTVLEAIHPEGIERLSEFSNVNVALGISRDECLKLVSQSDAIIIKSVIQADKELLNASNRLQIVGRAGTGVDNIDLEEAEKRGVNVLTVPTGNSVTAAEYTILTILMLCRKLPEVLSFVKENDFRRHLLEGRELQKMTVGLVGLGNVGLGVAERLKPFGCKILGWDPVSSGNARFTSIGGELVKSFEEMLPKIDILSFHARLTSDNFHMMDEPQFNLVKNGLFLINGARAGLINTDALLVAINNGKVEAAGLDVLEPEPPFDLKPHEHCYKHKLLNHPKIFITPHVGASTFDAQRRIALDLVEQMRRILMPNLYDEEQLYS
jgi:D-3-phosphoglycerate dehydrogenase / 2-oxoglutarate reductase